MADGNLAKSPIKRGSSVPSFSNPEMENSPNLQPGFACTALSDFEAHHLQSPWQQNPETHFSFSGDHGDNKRLLPTFFSVGMDSYGNAQFPNMGAPAWDNRGSYSSMVSNAIAGNSPGYMSPEQFHEGPGHMNAGLDYISPRLEHIQPGNAHVNGEALLRKMVSLPQLSPEMDKFFNCSSWAVSATMDPLGEGIKMQGMNPAASHCLANLPTDPGFTDRAARFSAFGNVGYSGSHLDDDCAKTLRKTTQTKAIEHHTIPRHSAPRSPLCIDNDNSNNIQESCKFPSKDGSSTVLKENLNMDVDGKVCMPIEGKAGMPKLVQSSVNESDESTGQEVSSSCEKTLGNEASPIRGLTASRKRKAAQKLKDSGANKNLVPDVTNLKCQQSGDLDPKQSNSGNSEASTPKSAPESSKPPEPLKQDYIHVRARRGQATDSHSLAERVRREKISERMKFLQDLVPGCSKVTGKAVMLDEIINYVQSLQRQVEFLSMKLAAVNPRVDFNIDNLFGRERLQPRPPAFGLDNANMYSSLHPHQQSPMPVQALSQFPPLDIQSLGSDPALRRTLSTPPSVDTCGNSVSVVSQAWDDELQRVVQMTFAPGSGVQTSVDLQGQIFPGQMKAEH